MNKKEREQLLRDTLDQCLSGLDDLPSDRAEVNRRLTETMPEAKRRIRFEWNNLLCRHTIRSTKDPGTLGSGGPGPETPRTCSKLFAWR